MTAQSSYAAVFAMPRGKLAAFDLRRDYHRVMQVSLALSILLTSLLFVLFPRLPAPHLSFRQPVITWVDEIPETVQVRRSAPQRPLEPLATEALEPIVAASLESVEAAVAQAVQAGGSRNVSIAEDLAPPPSLPAAKLEQNQAVPDQAAVAPLVKLSELDRVPRPRRQVAASYPDRARLTGYDGTVFMRVLVDENGTPRQVLPLDRRDELVAFYQEAEKAIMKWEFSPAFADGGPVKTWTMVPLTFHAPNGNGGMGILNGSGRGSSGPECSSPVTVDKGFGRF